MPWKLCLNSPIARFNTLKMGRGVAAGHLEGKVNMKGTGRISHDLEAVFKMMSHWHIHDVIVLQWCPTSNAMFRTMSF